MSTRAVDSEHRVEISYRAGGDPGFAEIVQAAGPLGPDELADVIDADASMRLRSGRTVALRRYLSGVPNLSELPVAMDAAIEACCRVAAERGEPDPVALLVRQHPDLEPQIRRSELLGQLFVRTAGKGVAPPARGLPCEIGPELGDGRSRYELRELLGFGSQGAVYLAVDRQLSEPEHPAWVAVKILRGRAPDPRDDRAWRSEATYLRRVIHPNVVRVLDRGITVQGEAFIVHDYVRGRNLLAVSEAASGGLMPRESASLVRELALGAQAVHSAGLVHCDLKPDNVILDHEGVPRIADFGVAAPRQPWSGAISQERLGSPAFMAPEQFRQEPGWLVPSSDIYALGAILYWLLCGQHPNGRTLADIERNLLLGGRTAAPSARDANERVPVDLDAICRRAMAPDPAQRYSSAEMLAADLDAFLGHRPLPWRRYSGLSLFGLLCRRQPLLVGMSAGVSALTIAVAAGALLVHEEHMGRELQSKIIAIQAAERATEGREAARRQTVAMAIRAMDSLSKDGVGAEWLPIMSALEAVGGPVLIGDAMDAGSLWARRISVAQDMVRDAGARGREGELEPLVWESALCLWLVRAGRSEEALQVLARNQSAWAERLRPQDRWLAKLRLLKACAESESALQALGRGGDSTDAASRSLAVLDGLLKEEPGVEDHDGVARLGGALLERGRHLGLIGAEKRVRPNGSEGALRSGH